MTTHDYKVPMSLSVLWRRWQELEKLDEDDEHADKLIAIEDRIVSGEAENIADLFAKLQFFGHVVRDRDWDKEEIEKLYGSIEDAYRKLVVKKNDDPWDNLQLAIYNMEGAGRCLEAMSENADAEVCLYLAEQLSAHAEAANAAFSEIHRADRAERDENFARLVPPPKPKDAQRDLTKLMVAALGPRTTVGEVEGARRMLRFMMDALPAPFDPPEADTAAEGGAS